MKANTFPDLGTSMKLLKISVELEDVPQDSIFGLAIHRGLREGNNLKSVIQMIKDQAGDNYKLVGDIVGEKLLREIISVNL